MNYISLKIKVFTTTQSNERRNHLEKVRESVERKKGKHLFLSVIKTAAKNV